MNNISLIILVISIIFIFIIFFKRSQKDSKNKTDHDIEDTETNNEMEILFFQEVKNGEKKIKLTHILDEFDSAFIKTIFIEERLPYFFEEDNTLNIWPQRKIGAHGNINLYVLEKNIDEVMKIIEDNRKG